MFITCCHNYSLTERCIYWGLPHWLILCTGPLSDNDLNCHTEATDAALYMYIHVVLLILIGVNCLLTHLLDDVHVLVGGCFTGSYVVIPMYPLAQMLSKGHSSPPSVVHSVSLLAGSDTTRSARPFTWLAFIRHTTRKIEQVF